ncbi:MAG TPA: hypothetical protein VJT73_03540 [Polyangiaceae bacterium]|nr:hypothetical protein [Polyangiaceae bacterium]
MTRPSKISSFAAAPLWAWLALTTACANSHGPGPGFATATELPQRQRRPDGVVVDPSPKLVPPATAADTRDEIVTLKPPLPEKAARAVVVAFFRAVVAEDIDAIADLFAEGASAPGKTGKGGHQGLVDHWRGRLRHFRYQALSGEMLFQDSDVEAYRFDDLETAFAGRPARPAEMNRDDLLLRVPLLIVRAGSDRVFGDEIVFLLKPEHDRFRVRHLYEDFQLP